MTNRASRCAYAAESWAGRAVAPPMAPMKISHWGDGTFALGVGYESEAAFSRAFKRAVGVAPGAWRAGHRPDGGRRSGLAAT
jgi:hypothetical protein